jgi:hypothetical protein
VNKLLILALLLTSCVKHTECTSVCDNMRNLGCSAADGSKNGTCEELCERFSQDPMVILDLKCLSTIKSCEEQDSCGTGN